jgi:hypothetical protein
MKHLDAYCATPLENLAEIAAGHPLRGAVDDLPPGEVGVVQMRNVNLESGIAWSEVARVELPPARRVALLDVGDVIFSTRGVNNFAIALSEVQAPAVCSPHFFVLKSLDPKRLDPKFLAWQINQRPSREYFQREATGSYILNIRREVVARLAVVAPPLAQQRAIVEIAEAARAERRTLMRMINNRDQQLEAIALDFLQASERPAA